MTDRSGTSGDDRTHVAPPRMRYVPGPALLLAFVILLHVAYVLAVLFGPILRGDDTFISLSHLGIWTAALGAGDPISIWTPTDAHGFGSPVPFFYHKLFNLAGALFALASGDVVTGFRLAVLLYSGIMFYGAFACARKLGADRLSGLVTGTACVFAPYAIDNIVERCAVAEYAAMAFVPLILALTIDFIQARNVQAWRGIAMFALLLLLALAHLFVFLMAVGLLLPLALGLLVRSSSGSVSLVAATLGALVIFAVFFYVPFSFWGSYFCPDQVRAYGLPVQHVLPLRAVFLPLPDSRAGWPALALIIGMVLHLRLPRKSRDSLALGLGVVALALIILMTRVATPVWTVSRQLDVVQFPWRLLAVATPLCLIALAGMIEKLSISTRRRVQFGILTISLANTLGMLFLLRLDHDLFPVAELQHDAPTAGIGRDAGGEYFPSSFQPALNPLTVWLVPVATVLPDRRPLIEGNGCDLPAVERPAYFHQLRISTTCPDGGQVRVNQFSTPFLESVAISPDNTKVKPRDDGPFIDFNLPAGKWTIVVKQRSYLDLVIAAWRAKVGMRSLH